MSFAARLQHADTAVVDRLSDGIDMYLNGVLVGGIFSAPYLEQEMGGSGSQPSVIVPDASVPAAVVGKPFVRDGITYKVVEAMPDGTGVTTLRLRT